MVSMAVACLPAAVNLLFLEALFMQISGVSLALTWPCRLCLLRVLLCASGCYKLSPFQAHWGRWHCTCFLRLVCLFTVHVGSGSSPLSCGVFPPTATFTSFPAPDCWVCAATPAFSGQLVYLQFREGFPLPLLRHSGCPALFATCLFCCYCLLFRFFFLFSLGGGWSVQGTMLIWPRVVCGSTAYCLAHLVVYVFPSLNFFLNHNK
jgi:hypothetical protein